jgi:hypothetical protein
MIIAYFIAILLLLWFIYPLFQGNMDKIIAVEGESDNLEYLKKRVYTNIKELEFDFSMGRLSDEDFNRIRQKFTSEASRVLRRIDLLNQKNYSKMIEADLKQLSSKKKGHFCPQCGEENPTHAKFCVACGGKF